MRERVLFAWRSGTSWRVSQVNRSDHHDALEFPDGRIVLLTQLCKGQHATVLQSPVTSPCTYESAEHCLRRSGQ